MPDQDTIEAPPQIDDQNQQPQPTPAPGDDKLRILHMAVGKEYNLGSFEDFKQKIQDPAKRKAFYNAVGKEYNLGSYDDFQKKISGSLSVPTPATPAASPPPEHQMQHDPIQDLRHVGEMAAKPVEGYSTAVGGMGGGGGANSYQVDPTAEATSKAYKAQYDKMATDKATEWGTKPETVKGVLQDFPDEQDESKLKGYAALAQSNPVAYNRFKNANDIRTAMAKDGPNGVNDANVFNHLQNADNYQQLTEENIPYQQQLMREHNLEGQLDKLKATQSPLINSLDPGLMDKYWNGPDKELGLTPDQFAGLETERLFAPNKAAMDEGIIKHSQGIGEDGKANPIDVKSESYAYRRGLENTLMNLDLQGRKNKSDYISGQRPEVDAQMSQMLQGYKDAISFATTPAEQQKIQDQFNAEPLVQKANMLEQGEDEVKYAASEDYRKYPLNLTDQATRLVKDATTAGNGKIGWADLRAIPQGMGEQADNTMRWLKNTAINLVGTEGAKSFNNTVNIGHQDLTGLSSYEGAGYSGVEQPLNVPREAIDAINKIKADPNLSEDEKEQKAISYVRDNLSEFTVNPKAGQQNLTGKSMIYSAASGIGQILGVANQSFLMGGLIGDASVGGVLKGAPQATKLQSLASAVTPMFMTTQNSLYEKALKNGDEHPLLSSNLDASIISLASLINPDANVVKKAIGIDTPLGKTIAGVSEDTWNKVLSENKPLVDRMTAGAKATGKQLALATLQYGLIAPTAQYLGHKYVLNEDPNLADMIGDGITQTAISMAAPAILHGVFGGLKATQVNPMQKYALVEAGLKSDQNIDLIDSKIKTGQISEVVGHDMKQLVKHAGEFLTNQEMVKTDGTPMSEQEVADNLYSNLRLKVLQGKLKTAAEPMKPVIEEKIHEVNKEISDLHTSDDDKQKTDLNQMLHEALPNITIKMPTMEGPIKDAIKANTPEDVFREIADQATQTTNVDGKEVSSRAATEEIFGKPLVEKAIELSKQKPKTNGEKTNDAQTEGQVKPSEGAALIGEEHAPSIQPTADFRTWDLGDMAGKPEDEAAKKHLEGVVQKWDQHPAGETGGETFGDFTKRVIPAFDKILKEESGNTTIVTHSSVLKAMRVWDEMGRPEIDKLTDEQKKEFAGKYNATETQNGDLETFKGDKGDIHVIRHGETEDNAKNNFRSGDTPLTPKGEQDAATAGQELKDKTGGDVPKIITSDLPRTLKTSNIINDKLQENAATNEPAASGQVEGDQNNAGTQSQEPGTAEPGTGGTGGIAGRVKAQREATTGVKAPDSGAIPTTQELVNLGRKLLKEGRDPEKDVRDFEADPDKNISANAMGTVRARLEELQKITNKAIDDHGEDSPEADAAKRVEEKWAERIQPMQTEWSRIGKVQMGDTDLDTGTVTSLKRAFKEVSGKPLTEAQAQTAKDLHAKLKQHENRISDLETQLNAAHKDGQPAKSTTFTDKAKKAADIFRKLKTKEFTFKDSNGNDIPIQKMGVGWNDLVELGAKAIEKSGKIADGIAAILDKVKDADWYKSLSKEDQDRFGKELEDHYTGIADKKTAARIKGLEKQLEDLQSGNVKDKGTPREPTAREKELKDQIFEAKQNLGLIRPKATPTPKTAIEKPTIDIATHFVDKKDNTFSPKEAGAIWDHTKEVLKTGDKEDFHGVVRQVAMDTGLTVDQVNRAINQPKGAKVITDKIYAETYRRNQIKQAAEIWVKSANQSAQKKFWNAAIKVPSAIVTALHGTVAPATHVGGDLYRPTNWKSYFTFMGNSYKFAFGGLTDAGKATYEKAMDSLTHDPMYNIAKKAGTKVDPTDLNTDDYSKYQGVFGKLAKMGERGFNAMKPYRLEQFKKLYNGLSDQAKGNDDVLKAIGNIVNLSSGTTSVKTGQYTDVAIFAPKLIVSQYQRIFSEPWKAFSAATNWSNATDAQKLQAKMVARHVGEMMTTYLAGLAANQAILSMTGSKQKINFTNPLAPDWMRFKVAGKDVDVSGGMNSSLRFVGSLAEEGLRANGVLKTDEKGKPGDTEGRKILQQAANKLSPLASDITEVFSTTDNGGNPLPWSSVKPSGDKHKLTWGEYFESKSPIFISEGFKAYNDAARENPAAKVSMNKYLEGVVIGLLAGTTGAKIQPDKPQKSASTGRTPRGEKP